MVLLYFSSNTTIVQQFFVISISAVKQVIFYLAYKVKHDLCLLQIFKGGFALDGKRKPFIHTAFPMHSALFSGTFSDGHIKTLVVAPNFI